MISAIDFSLQGDKHIGKSYSEMDCQKLIEKMLKDVGISLDLPGSNAWFRKMTWTGSPEECKRKFGKIPVGAFLFIHNFDGGEVKRGYTDGLGNASHIGVYIAREDGAIHSSSTRGCVAYSKFVGKTIKGGWNMIGLWDRLSYGQEIDNCLHGQETDNHSGGETMTAVVTSENGNPVRLRKKQSTKSDIITELPVGTEVEVIEPGTEWSKISWEGKTGWMMSAFLRTGDDPDPDDSQEDDALILLRSIATQAEILVELIHKLVDQVEEE